MKKPGWLTGNFLIRGTGKKVGRAREGVPGEAGPRIRNHYSYALALIRESQKVADKGMETTASELLNYAERMAPTSRRSPSSGRVAEIQAFRSFGNSTQSAWSWLREIIFPSPIRMKRFPGWRT